MKSGLYACAGASAIASAAAWAKRFDEPMTNESKEYFGLMLADPSARGDDGRLGPRRRGRPHDELEPPLAAHGVGDAGTDQVGEPPLDPLAGEVVRHGEDEPLLVEVHGGDLAEPVAEGLLVEGAAQPGRHVVPE